MRQSHMVLGLFGSPNSLKRHRLINQDLLIKRWSQNGIREEYFQYTIRKKIQSPPKSISQRKVTVERRVRLN